ncbi:hypothetical protein CCR75_001342 [Bremia lactucae]|uniref:Uncharacterized protein n=1 Tax=Bremia lactucae TaxID=4779 RepID=A0A976IB51_BRELC|nr:hypothetical protein CCR75_001342 [Bremia lactucae]
MMLPTRRRKLLDAALLCNVVLSCSPELATVFQPKTPFLIFNDSVTTICYMIFPFVAFALLHKTPSDFSVRFWDVKIGCLVGTSSLELMLAFESATYWGFEAHHTKAIAAYFASGLHALIFAVQCGITTLVVKCKDDVIDTYAAYEYIPDISYSGNVDPMVLAPTTSPTYYQNTMPTADAEEDCGN